MIHGINIRLNLDPYRGQLDQELNRILVSLRTVLRSIDDGSYRDKGNQPRSSGVITFQASDTGQSKEDWTRSEVLNAYSSVMRAFIDFIDKMIAVLELDIDKLSVRVERDLNGEAEIIDYVTTKINAIVSEAIQRVSVDTSLTNPKKLGKFSGLSDFSTTASLSYFALRRCIEHHKSVPQSYIELLYRRLRLQVSGQEITALPFTVEKGAEVSMDLLGAQKRFEEGKAIVLTEEDLEHLVVTIRMVIAPEIATTASNLINARIANT